MSNARQIENDIVYLVTYDVEHEPLNFIFATKECAERRCYELIRGFAEAELVCFPEHNTMQELRQLCIDQNDFERTIQFACEQDCYVRLEWQFLGG